MGKPKNDAIYKLFAERFKALQSVYTIGDAPIKRTIAKEYALLHPDKSEDAAYQMVCYYLRGGNKREGVKDSRRTYTVKELANLELMNTADRESYAVHTGRSLRAVEAALARFRKAGTRYSELAYATDVVTEYIDKAKHYDFSSALHLKTRDRTKSQLAAAKVYLAGYGLSLRAPNILYHNATRRRFYMVTGQQDSMLEDPKRFLYICQVPIKNGWTTCEFDPIADDCLKIPAENHSFTPVHRHERNKDTKEMVKIAVRAKELLEKMVCDGNLQHGFPVCESLKVLKVWVDKALETAHPESHYIDHVGVAGKKNVQWVDPEDGASRKGEAPAEGDDAWVKDFKSVN